MPLISRLGKQSMEPARRVEHQMTDKGYVPVYTTAVIEQPWDGYSAEEH